MIVLNGPSMLSEPKRNALISKIRQIDSRVTSVDAIYLHFVSATSTESEDLLLDVQSPHRLALNQLLAYGEDRASPSTRKNKEQTVFVYPRPGSISPWSSKATDIAKICNLSDIVERLERGCLFVFQMEGDAELYEGDVKAFVDAIHDRMTQAWNLVSPSEEDIFSHRNPAKSRPIDLAGSSPE